MITITLQLDEKQKRSSLGLAGSQKNMMESRGDQVVEDGFSDQEEVWIRIFKEPF